MPSQTSQQNSLASAAKGSKCCCHSRGTWHFASSPPVPGGAAAADREPCRRGSTSHPGGQGGGQQMLPNDCARSEFPRSSSRTRCALARKSVTQGASRLQCARETRDGNNWQSPPRDTGVLGKVCRALQLKAGSRGARTPSISASGCLFLAVQLKPPFVPKLSPFAPAQPRAVGLTKSMQCPLPTAPGGGDAERHFYLQLEPDGLGKDSPPFHPDHWSTSKAAGA